MICDYDNDYEDSEDPPPTSFDLSFVLTQFQLNIN